MTFGKMEQLKEKMGGPLSSLYIRVKSFSPRKKNGFLSRFGTEFPRNVISPFSLFPNRFRVKA